jgi:hypothetical protein
MPIPTPITNPTRDFRAGSGAGEEIGPGGGGATGPRGALGSGVVAGVGREAATAATVGAVVGRRRTVRFWQWGQTTTIPAPSAGNSIRSPHCSHAALKNFCSLMVAVSEHPSTINVWER